MADRSEEPVTTLSGGGEVTHVMGEGEYMWAYRIGGIQESRGTMVWDFDECGIVRGDCGEHAVGNLVGDVLWDSLDDDEPFTIEMRPFDPDEAPPAATPRGDADA